VTELAVLREPSEQSRNPLGTWLRICLLSAGFLGLLVLPFVVPNERTHTARDPYGQALKHLLVVEPGMIRSVLESHLQRQFRRSDGVEVFGHPDSDHIRLDVRLDGDRPDSRVIAVGDPYFAPFPEPRHLR
jgi:hypothetical protein